MLKMLFISLLIPGFANGADVLFLPPLVSDSHKIALAVWADALANRNYSVYWWAPAPRLDSYQPKSAVAKVEHFVVNLTEEYFDQKIFDRYLNDSASSLGQMLWHMTSQPPFIETSITRMVSAYCASLLDTRKARFDELARQKFDLIVIDELFNPCGYLLINLMREKHAASPLDQPAVIVYVSTCRQTRQSMSTNGVFVPYSYVPHMGSLSVLTDSLNFWQRLQTLISYSVGYVVDAFNYFMIYRQLVPGRYPQLINMHMIEALQKPDFQVYCTPKVLDFATPLAPNHAYIGGIQLNYEHSKKFDPNMASLVENSSRGFVVVAMGHWTTFHAAGQRILSAFVHAFTKLAREENLLVIWAYSGPHIANLHENVKLYKWIPQRALLAHSKCKLLVTHAGCNSVTEALWHKVPIVAIPLFAEQGDCAARIVKKGAGVLVLKNNISAEAIHAAAASLVHNERFAANSGRLASMFRQGLCGQSGLDLAVYWSEFVAKHSSRIRARGGRFLTLPNIVHRSAWYKLYGVDVVLFWVVLTAAGFYVVFSAGRFLSAFLSSF